MSVIEKLDSVLAKWHENAEDNAAYGELLQAGKAVAYEDCADDLDALMPAIRQALLKACYWDTFCELAEAGTFHAGVLEDAKHMGAGVLEMAMKDAAIDARLASDSEGGE